MDNKFIFTILIVLIAITIVSLIILIIFNNNKLYCKYFNRKEWNLWKKVIKKLKEAEIINVAKCDNLPNWAKQSIDELVEQEQYTEINNRFYKTLEFGTGGMRSRTIAEYLTKAELGNSTTKIPEFIS